MASKVADSLAFDPPGGASAQGPHDSEPRPFTYYDVSVPPTVGAVSPRLLPLGVTLTLTLALTLPLTLTLTITVTITLTLTLAGDSLVF